MLIVYSYTTMSQFPYFSLCLFLSLSDRAWMELKETKAPKASLETPDCRFTHAQSHCDRCTLPASVQLHVHVHEQHTYVHMYSQSVQGMNGDPGATGMQGAKGIVGDMGVKGHKGELGVIGETGPIVSSFVHIQCTYRRQSACTCS